MLNKLNLKSALFGFVFLLSLIASPIFAADTKISDYPEATTLSATDLFITAQEDFGNKKATFATLKNYLWLPPGYITGLVPSNNATDADHDIDISAGYCIDSTNAKAISGAASTKRIDAAWAVGSAAGGLDGTESSGGTPDASTIYNIFAILRSDTGVVDYCYSENSAATGPSRDATPIPVAYDYWRWIGFVRTDASANIKPIYVTGKGTTLYIVYKDYDSVATGLTQTSFTAQSLTANLPPLDKILSVKFFNVGADWLWLSIDGVHTFGYFGTGSLTDGGSTEYWTSYPILETPIIGNQIYYKSDGTSHELCIKTVTIVR